MSERPVAGYDDMADLSRGHISLEVDEYGGVRVAATASDGAMLGNLYLSLAEFAKVVWVAKDQVKDLYEDSPDLPW